MLDKPLSLLKRISSVKRATRLPNKDNHVVITFVKKAPVACIDKHYLSFTIDISVLLGGHWWEGSKNTYKGLGTLKVPPINLNSKKLDQLVKALGPAYLRVGGSEADKANYFHNENNTEKEDESGLLLSYKTWDELHNFLARNQLKFIFTFKYGLFKRSDHGLWRGSESEKLLRYSKEKGYMIDVCELGNELNAYWAFHGLTSQPRAYKLAKDYETFAQLVRSYFPTCKVSGPGSAFWPLLGETIRPFSNITEKFLQSLKCELDIINWHYYPFQSTRSPIRTRTASIQSFLSPDALESYTKYSHTLRSMRDKHQPNAALWTGETGSAQCGGQPKISDRFASCFWWADQLGRGASLGQSVMVRQSLIGGEYGLIDRLTLKPKPDYWVSWLWGKLIGQLAYQVNNNDKQVKIYCHNSKEAEGYILLIINMSSNYKNIKHSGFGHTTKQYEITAKKLTSKKVFINGIKPKLIKGKLELSDFPQLPKLNTVKPYSINFWCCSH